MKSVIWLSEFVDSLIYSFLVFGPVFKATPLLLPLPSSERQIADCHHIFSAVPRDSCQDCDCEGEDVGRISRPPGIRGFKNS